VSAKPGVDEKGMSDLLPTSPPFAAMTKITACRQSGSSSTTIASLGHVGVVSSLMDNTCDTDQS